MGNYPKHKPNANDYDGAREDLYCAGNLHGKKLAGWENIKGANKRHKPNINLAQVTREKIEKCLNGLRVRRALVNGHTINANLFIVDPKITKSKITATRKIIRSVLSIIGADKMREYLQELDEIDRSFR